MDSLKIGYNGAQVSNKIDGGTRVARNTFEHLNSIGSPNEVIMTSFGREKSHYSNNEYKELQFRDFHHMMEDQRFFGDCKFDLYHTPHPFHVANGVPYTPLFLGNCASVLTVLDLILYKNVCKSSKESCEIFQDQLNISCQWADGLIAISDFTKKDIVENIGVDPDKIKVIYVGLEKKFFDEISREEVIRVRQCLDLPEKYIFYLCNKFPHKNLETLIQAFSRVVKDSDVKEDLVLSGKSVSPSEDDKILSLVNSLGLQDRVRFLDYIEEKDILPFYKGASLMVYPSLYEGFGLPPVEAMAGGVPVVASNVTSIPEVVGDAAYLVDPSSDSDIANGIVEVLTNENLKNSLINKGKERAQLYDWDKIARETMSYYERTYERYKSHGKQIPRKKELNLFFRHYSEGFHE